jgi:ubiquinone biosynthesis UbiH/UbiF/VisC/COQ6 family hydroxylase
MAPDAPDKVVIVGGGPVGLSFALAVADIARFEIQVIEGAAPCVHELPDGFDQRIYAISPGNRSFLESLGVWQEMPRERIAAVSAMRVWGDDRAHELHLEERAPLAYILEQGALLNALSNKVREAKALIRVHAPAKPAHLSLHEDCATLSVEEGLEFVAELVVGADGADSWVRQQAGLDVKAKSYDSFGVVANFRCEYDHEGIARQWFIGGSVLAWLPLPGKRMSMVWSVSTARSAQLLALSPALLAQTVREAGDDSLGNLECISAPARFPLRRILAESWVANHVALMGDAAHTIHPLAGQGVNLGFADAHLLAKILHSLCPLQSAGDRAVLRSYARERAENTLALAILTDQLRSLFARPEKLVAGLRNAGIGLANRQSLLKRTLIRYAMQ